MPSVFARIESLIGPEATARLLERLGGRRIWIRVTPAAHAGDVVTDAIGLDLSRIVSRAFGGETVQLPVSEALEWRRRASERRQRIFLLYEQDRLRPGEIAAIVKCSERFVYRVLNGK